MRQMASRVPLCAAPPLTGLPVGHAMADAVEAAICRTFPEADKAVCDPLLGYRQGHGGLARQGFPIGNAFDEASSTSGQLYPARYFERARFAYHPESGDPQYRVLPGLRGRERFLARYPGGIPTVTAGSTPAIAPTPATGPSPVATPTVATPTDAVPTATAAPRPASPWAGARAGCDPSYPTLRPSPPPDLDRKDIPCRNFPVRRSDPRRLDDDGDGVGRGS